MYVKSVVNLGVETMLRVHHITVQCVRIALGQYVLCR